MFYYQTFFLTLTFSLLVPLEQKADKTEIESFSQQIDNREEWVQYLDTISGLIFEFPDTPILYKNKTGELTSYEIRYTEPGSSFIVIIDVVDYQTEEADSILLESLEKLLDNRSNVLEQTIFDKPYPRITAKVSGRYAVYLDYQAVLYESLIIRQVALNLGAFQKESKVNRFFLSF